MARTMKFGDSIFEVIVNLISAVVIAVGLWVACVTLVILLGEGPV
jgi:hypothetical protein